MRTDRPAPTFDLRPTSNGSSDPSPKILALVAFAVSSIVLAHYYRYSQILLSGDAVAHINIARRVFDSRTPGPMQIGTVWLPLQHVLTIPFVVSDFLWSSGIGGAIPSMLGYVLGVLGVYRLVRDGLQSRSAAWIAAVIYGANPNLLYVQTTALNEPLSMALLTWAVVWFSDFTRALTIRRTGVSPVTQGFRGPEAGARSLILCGFAILANLLLRYDGWFHGCAFLAATAVVLFIAHRRAALPRAIKKAARTFLLLVAIGPAAWFVWNAANFGNPLEFATGPYSAKAIEERSRGPGDPHQPGWRAPRVAALYYLRDLQLNLGAGRLLAGPPTQAAFAPTVPPGRWEKPWLPIALFGSLVIIFLARASWPLLLLWLPLPFYTIAVAWGGVPLFIPVWWPFSYYNARYALQLLPAVAVCWSAAAWLLMRARRSWLWRAAIIAGTLAVVAASYASIRNSVPITLREVRANGGARYAIDAQLATILRRLPPDASILMYIGDHGVALLRATIPLRRTINEGNRAEWKAALQNPAASADYIIAADGDPLSDAVRRHPQGLMIVGVVEAPWQRPVRIYRPIRNP